MIAIYDSTTGNTLRIEGGYGSPLRLSIETDERAPLRPPHVEIDDDNLNQLETFFSHEGPC